MGTDTRLRLQGFLTAFLGVIVSCLACSAPEQPSSDATPEFVMVRYEAGISLDKGYADLSASLTTDNGVTMTGFMLGPDEVNLEFFRAELKGLVFSVRVGNLEEDSEYCFYARAGNGRNEIRTKLIRFKTEKGGQTAIIPGNPDDPGNEDYPENPDEPDNPAEPEDPGNPETPGDVVLPPDGVGIIISDPVLLRNMLSLHDADSDGKLLMDEIMDVESISVNTDDICTMDGIQYFVGLKQLVCSGSVWKGSLTSLALGSNAALETLDCSYNHISTISLPSSLAELQCRFNSLLSVNLGNCRRLKALDCFGNMLEHLDLSGLGELESLVAGMNSFTDLDLSGNLKLKYVDLSDSPFLETVYVARGQKIEELIVGNSVDIEYKE